MAFIPAPDCARCEINYVVNNHPISNILNFVHDTPGFTQADLINLADTVDNWVELTLMPTMSSGCTYTGLRAVELNLPNGLFVERLSATPGGLVGPILPLNCAIVLKHTTPRIGRSFRGRTYIAPLRDADVTDNFFDPSTAGDLIAAFDTLRNAVIAVGWRFCVLSYYRNNAPRTEGDPTEVVATSMTSLRVDTRRKRLPSEN